MCFLNETITLILFYLAIVCLRVLYTQAKFWSETFDPVLCHYGDFVLSNDQGKILYFVTGYPLLKSCTYRASEIVEQVKVLLHKPENPGFGTWSHCKDAMKEPTSSSELSCDLCVCAIAFVGPY